MRAFFYVTLICFNKGKQRKDYCHVQLQQQRQTICTVEKCVASRIFDWRMGPTFAHTCISAFVVFISLI